MNNLTNDVTRLCDEIAALREGRATFLRDLAADTAAMQGAVADLLTTYGTARADMASQSKAERNGFLDDVRHEVSGLKQKVLTLQEDFREDLAGTRRAWRGLRRTAERSRLAARLFGTPAGKTKRKKR